MRVTALLLTLLLATAAVTATAGAATAKRTDTVRHVTLRGKSRSMRARIALRGVEGQVCWRFTKRKGFTKPTAAAIHKGAKGKTGAIVVPLGSKFARTGCVKTLRSRIAAIQAKPKAYYVNVTSAKFPTGAVRGQL